MKKLFLFLVAFFALCNIMVAQDNEADTAMESMHFLVPDYDFLARQTADKSSPYYYPTLVKRFLAADTTLGLEELHCLYYGSVVQEGYDPYGHPAYESEVRELLNKENVSEKEAKKALKILDKAMKEYPTEPKVYLYRHYANSVLYGAESDQARDDAFRYVMLIQVIGASGDGDAVESAFHVAIPWHAYSFMNYYGFSMTSQSLVNDNGQSFDMYEVRDNKYGVEKIYFNITPSFRHLNKMFTLADDDDTDNEPAERIDINVGTKVVVKLKKSRGTYLMTVVDKQPFNDTLQLGANSDLFPSDGEENTIIFYCARAEGGKIFLVMKSFCKEMLSYDSFFRLEGSADFVSTSNDGIFSKVVGTEIWSDPIATIRVSNLRPMK